MYSLLLSLHEIFWFGCVYNGLSQIFGNISAMILSPGVSPAVYGGETCQGRLANTMSSPKMHKHGFKMLKIIS